MKSVVIGFFFNSFSINNNKKKLRRNNLAYQDKAKIQIQIRGSFV